MILYEGVSRGDNETWLSHLELQGNSILIGSFADPHQAASAYNEAAGEVIGTFAAVNHLPDGLIHTDEVHPNHKNQPQTLSNKLYT